MSETAVNNQIIDGAVSAAMLSIGASPSASSAMLDLALTECVAAAMRNAVARQQQSSISGAAAATALCARLLGVPFAPTAASREDNAHD